MTKHPGTFVAGLMFVVVGVIYLFEVIGAWDVDATRLWPILLIAVGAVVLISGWRRKDAPSDTEPAGPRSDDAA